MSDLASTYDVVCIGGAMMGSATAFDRLACEAEDQLAMGAEVEMLRPAQPGMFRSSTRSAW